LAGLRASKFAAPPESRAERRQTAWMIAWLSRIYDNQAAIKRKTSLVFRAFFTCTQSVDKLRSQRRSKDMGKTIIKKISHCGKIGIKH
jgi:hypothetical protein